jgi:cytoskeletal protein RodZ
MIWPVRIRHVSMGMMALVLLTLALSLGACSRNVANQAAPTVETTQKPQAQQSVSQSTAGQQSTPISQSTAGQQSTSSQPPAQSSTSNVTQVQSTDQQIQKTLHSLDNAQNDVNTSSSIQENDQQP